MPCTTSSTGFCLSDAQNAQLIIDLVKGENKRDQMLCWLLVYHGYEGCET